ncbi:MAG: hypothetical protein M5R36_21490 [Deltaproteobacteria bacterium]|nr:hypothetical protein [Deltaproteobacteria bacterium]
MAAQVLLLGILVMLMGAVGWTMGGPPAGALTAAFTVSMPAVLQMAFAYDDHLINTVGVVLAVWLILGTNGWRRVLAWRWPAPPSASPWTTSCCRRTVGS